MTNKIHLLFNECSDVFKRCNDETLTPSGSFPIGTAEINIHTYIHTYIQDGVKKIRVTIDLDALKSLSEKN